MPETYALAAEEVMPDIGPGMEWVPGTGKNQERRTPRRVRRDRHRLGRPGPDPGRLRRLRRLSTASAPPSCGHGGRGAAAAGRPYPGAARTG